MPNVGRAPSKPFVLGLALFPGCMPAGLFATCDLVRACNLRAGRVAMEVRWVGADSQPVATHQGPQLRPEWSMADAQCDAWLIPGLWLSSTDELDGAIREQGTFVEAARAASRRTPLWSYCAGVALAAATGRLDGHDATATWWLQPSLAARFARVNWHGAGDLVVGADAITASGPSGYLPLMLDRLAQHFTDDVLRDVQELLMLPNPRTRHPAFQSVEMMGLEEPKMRALLSWAQATPAQDVTLAAAAKQHHVSIRTLCRWVERGASVPAGEWLRLVKLSQAAEALRITHTPIKRISDQLGFGTEAALYRAFQAATHMTPSTYRQAYGVRMPPSDLRP